MRIKRVSRVRRAATAVVVMALGIGVALMSASPANAATFTVTNGNDAGGGSLRQAILSANLSPGADLIEISYNAAAIAPTSTLPAIDDDVSVVGTVPNVVISGSLAGATRGLQTTLCVDVALTDLRVVDFALDGIYSPCGSIDLTGVTSSDNGGNGLRAVGSVDVDSSTFNSNDDFGIAVSVTNGELENVTASSNGGIGIEVLSTTVGAQATIDGVTTTGNGYAGLRMSATPGTMTATDVLASGANYSIMLEADGALGTAALSLDSSEASNSIANVYSVVSNNATATVDNVLSTDSGFYNFFVMAQLGARVDLVDSQGFTGSALGMRAYAGTGGTINVIDSELSSNSSSGIEIYAQQAGSSVNLSGVTLRDNNATLAASQGGAVSIVGSSSALVTLDDCDIVDNQATRGAGLAAEVTGATLEVSNSRFTGNTATNGGGLYLYRFDGASASFSLTDSLVSDNDASGVGGGIYFNNIGNAGATGGVYIARTTIADNTAAGNGGGIEASNWGYNVGGAALWIEDSTISGNTSGALGGGIHADNGLVVITNPVDWVMINSTVSGNSAAVAGGGIAIATFLQSPLTQPMTLAVAHSTVVDNVAPLNNGGGIRLADYIHAVYDHSVLANNGTEDSLRNGGTTVLTVDHSLIEAPDAATLMEMDLGAGNIDGVDPLLGALADNGSDTLTHLPLAGSPLIDAGDPGIAGAPPLDQRERARIIGVIDIGAVEVQPILAATGVQLSAPVAGGAVLGLIGILLLLARRRAGAPLAH